MSDPTQAPARSERPSAERPSAEPPSAEATAQSASRLPPRPIIERIGMAAIALVLAAVFGVMAAAAWVNGEWFLGAMAGLGAVMTVWAGVRTLRRG